MKIHRLFEKSHYKKQHECKTPGAVYSTNISGKTISTSVELPFVPELTEDSSGKLEADLHYAIEGVLAKLFEKAE